MQRLSIARSRSDSRRALTLAPAAGVLALLAALGRVGAVAAAKRLEAERRRLKVTIDSLTDGLIVTEPDSATVRTLNPRATELLPELAPGGRLEGGPLPPLEAALAGEATVEHEGKTLAITATHFAGGQDGIVWTVRDVTERARVDRARSEFVATASHELRSPLTSIKGFVELLERTPAGMSSRQREFVDIISRSTDRLVDLVNDLLDVARIEADRLEINPRPVDVGEAVREVVELMGPQIAGKRQQLGTHIAPVLPPALADPSRVRQIVANLLTNAHLYTSPGGRIHVGVEPDRAWIQIVVEDSGVGMTSEQAERAFERFYRAPGGDQSIPGTGLGLSIVKSLVDLHRGQIEVDSDPGRGTLFRVRLPVAAPETFFENAVEAIRGRRVLVVDDEREVAELIARQLAPLETTVEIATSGKEALAALSAKRFDAVTLDILMPGMDGFEVLRAIRADPQLTATPIVLVSVFSSREELAGEWSVSKPIDADELRWVLGGAVAAGRSRVLVIAREKLKEVLEPSLDDLGIEHEWVENGGAAGRVCSERRFEVALVDIGVRNPQAVLQALDLRGRRLRRAVILFSDGTTPVPAGISRLGMEVVTVQQAAEAITATLRGQNIGAGVPDG